MTSATRITSSASSGVGGSSSSVVIPNGLSGVLVATPTVSTPAGYYINIAGIPPNSPSIAVGDVYAWDGTSASLHLVFSQAPDVLSTGGETYRKHVGVWVSDALMIGRLLSAAPTLATPAGWYIQVSGNLPIGSGNPPALNDIYFWPSKAGVYPVKYLGYADAPQTVNVSGTVYRKNNGGWLAETPAIAALLGAAPTQALAAGYYSQIAGSPLAGISLGDIFYWSGTAASIYTTYAAAPSSIAVASDTCSKWAGTWIPDNLTVAKTLTSAPALALADGIYVQIAGIPPSGLSLNSIFMWIGGAAVTWFTYADSPETLLIAGELWEKHAGTWIPANLSISDVLFTKPTAAGFYTQLTGVLPGVIGGGTLSYGDIYWFTGVLATKYVSYADAPQLISVSGATYAKTAGVAWSQIGAPSIRSQYPIVTQYQDGSRGLASTFIPVGTASVLDTATQWNGGNLLRIATDKVRQVLNADGSMSVRNLSSVAMNGYVRQLITVTPGVDNTYFLKVISDAYRWTALHVFVCDKVTGAPIYRCHAQSNTANQDSAKFTVHTDPLQGSAGRLHAWEWFSFAIPQDAVDANLMSGNQLTIALAMDFKNSEGYFYVDGWGVAANPYSFCYTPAVSFEFGLELPGNFTYSPASWWGGVWNSSGWVNMAGSSTSQRCCIPIPRVDKDIIITFVGHAPSRMPSVELAHYRDIAVAGKKIGVPSANVKSRYNPPSHDGQTYAGLIVSASDLQRYCYKYWQTMAGTLSSMNYLRMNLTNSSAAASALSSIYSELA